MLDGHDLKSSAEVTERTRGGPRPRGAQLSMVLKQVLEDRREDEQRGIFQIKPSQWNDAHLQILAGLQTYAKNTPTFCR